MLPFLCHVDFNALALVDVLHKKLTRHIGCLDGYVLKDSFFGYALGIIPLRAVVLYYVLF